MPNYKRKRPKSGRAGCLMCKPYKDQRNKGSFNHQSKQERIAIISEEEQKKECAR